MKGLLKYLVLFNLLWLPGCEGAVPSTAETTSLPTLATAIESLPAATFQVTPTELSTSSPTPTAALTSTPHPTRTANPTTVSTATPPTPTPFITSGEVTFHLDAQSDGELTTIALVEETIFAGQGPRLVSLDVSDPLQPLLIGQSKVLPGIVDNVLVHEETAYVTANQYLFKFDVGNPSELVLESQTELPGHVGVILLRNGIIYAAGQLSIRYDDNSQRQVQSYVATVDVGSEPRLLDTIIFSGDVTALALAKETLYVGQRDGLHSLTRVDITNPAQVGDLLPVGGVPEVSSLRVYGDTLLVGSFYELTAFDASSPIRPSFLWREEGPELAQVEDIATYGDKLYTVGRPATDAYGRVNLANATIELAEPFPKPDYEFPTRLVATGNHLYHAVELEESMLVAGGDVAISGNILYAGRESGGLNSYQLPDLERLNQTAPEALKPGRIYTIEAAEDRFYLTKGAELEIVDVEGLSLLGRLYSDSDSFLLSLQRGATVSIPVIDHIVYMPALAEGKEQIIRFDVGDPAQPTQLDVIPFDWDLRVTELAATQQWLVVSLHENDDQDWLYLYDLATESPQLVASIAVGQAPGEIEIHGDLLLAGTGGAVFQSDSLRLFSLPDLTQLAEIPIPSIWDIETLGDLAFVTSRFDQQLMAFDISDPTAPWAVGSLALPESEGNIAMSEDYLVVGNRRMGLFVFRVNR